MNELIVTIMLVIPSPHKMVDWTVNEVPTQIQIVHKSGLEVSYTAMPVPCTFRPRHSKEMVFRSPEDRCYSVYDLSSPRFVRHPYYWHKIELPKPLDDMVNTDGR
tara:strand:+ start:334 stop:648 length:315 start_codon:yes stop_codon:yes gene_type:complete